MLNLALAVVVVAHAIGHVLFLAPALRLVNWADQTGHSWLLTGIVGDPLTRAVAAAAWTATALLFLAGTYGFLTSQDWWRPVIVAAAVVSLAAIVVMWDGIATSSAFMAAAFDIAVIVAVAWARWPATSATTPS
jgi:hypothetical protein